MSHNAIPFVRVLLLAGAVGVLSAGATAAAPPGGIHDGARSGFPHSGFHLGLHNNFHNGLHHNGLHNGPGFRGFRSPGGFLYDRGYSYPSGYAYPYPYPGSRSAGFAYYPYFGAGRYAPPPDEEEPAPRKQPRDAAADVTVKLPAGAELWFDDQKTKSTGYVRHFVTPKLTAGQNYSYKLEARWREDGREVKQTRTARVRAGADVEVDFTAPPESEKPAPPAKNP
jgi:uncharacterized protein (TIGR03000 family)